MTEEYKFNKYIFGLVVIINLLFLFQIIANNGFDLIKPYKKIECPADAFAPCLIPGTLNETIQPGQYIENRQLNLEIANKFNTSVITSLILALIINHLFFNRKYKFEWLQKLK